MKRCQFLDLHASASLNKHVQTRVIELTLAIQKIHYRNRMLSIHVRNAYAAFVREVRHVDTGRQNRYTTSERTAASVSPFGSTPMHTVNCLTSTLLESLPVLRE